MRCPGWTRLLTDGARAAAAHGLTGCSSGRRRLSPLLVRLVEWGLRDAHTGRQQALKQIGEEDEHRQRDGRAYQRELPAEKGDLEGEHGDLQGREGAEVDEDVARRRALAPQRDGDGEGAVERAGLQGPEEHHPEDGERPRVAAHVPFHDAARHPHVEAVSYTHLTEPTRLGMISYAVFCLK